MPSEPSTRTDPAMAWKFPTTTPMGESSVPNTRDVFTDSPDDQVAPLPMKKPSAAVYPLMAGRTKKPFSRSAQKRQSVQMLGSIEHLQHHFAKIGLTSKKPPPSKLGGLPALGPGALSPPNSPASTSVPLLPPSPAHPGPAPKPAYLTAPPVKIDPEAFKVKAVEALGAVVALWGLSTRDEPRRTSVQVDILDVLKSTVAAIRAVRAYSLSLPSSAFRRSAPSSGFLPGPTRQSISTTSRPSLRVVSGGARPSEEDKDPLLDVRKAALEVLVSLRALEEKCRVEGSNNVLTGEPLTDSERSDDNLSPTQEATPSMLSSMAGPLEEEPLYEEEAEYHDGVNFGTENRELRKTWEEKLASGEEGWLYRTDVNVVSEFPHERQGIKTYLETVEEVLFGAGETYEEERQGWAWAWPRETSLQSKAAADGMSRLDEPDSWAHGDWKGREMNQLHDFLLTHLPLPLQILIPDLGSSGDASSLLERLSDGYILALVFNAAIERSQRPWGQISGADVHETLEAAASETETKDWTFKRAQNLTAFAAALRHRYNIPIHIPTSAPSSVDPLFLPAQPGAGTISGRRVSGQRPSTMRGLKIDDEGIMFDPLVVARRDTGWEAALQALLLPWLSHVLMERLSITS